MNYSIRIKMLFIIPVIVFSCGTTHAKPKDIKISIETKIVFNKSGPKDRRFLAILNITNNLNYPICIPTIDMDLFGRNLEIRNKKISKGVPYIGPIDSIPGWPPLPFYMLLPKSKLANWTHIDKYYKFDESALSKYEYKLLISVFRCEDIQKLAYNGELEFHENLEKIQALSDEISGKVVEHM